MTRSQPSPMRPLLAVHLLVLIAIGIWWSAFFWRHTPARPAYRRAASNERVRAHEGQVFISFDPLFAGVRLALGDLAGGCGCLLLFALGTRVYVRRLQVWLDARTSGEAVAFGATDLERAALSANSDRRATP
jgi:hypothetical protein